MPVPVPVPGPVPVPVPGPVPGRLPGVDPLEEECDNGEDGRDVELGFGLDIEAS